MKAVILAGGMGTRLREETESRPKPLIEIGGRPILWHIMKIYGAHGITDFVVCLGYKGYLIKEYFANYFLHLSDVTIDLRRNATEIHHNHAEPWRITLIDTGEQTMTGGRLKRVMPYLDEDEPFCLTYGDGVADVDIGASVAAFERADVLAQVTAVRPPGRFGVLDIGADGRVGAFQEKIAGGWINGGFFVLSKRVADYIDDDATPWEAAPLERLAAAGQLATYRHEGFWQCMDTLRDKQALDALWATGQAPWRVWPR